MAVTRLTLHIVHEPNRQQAIALLNENTVLARQAKGFISRHVYFAKDDPLKGYSITTFGTREELDAFTANPARPKLEMKGSTREVHLKTETGSILLFKQTESALYEELVP